MTVQRRAAARTAAEHGFTLIEMLVATAIMVVVTAGVFSLINPAQGTYQAQPQVSDMQQRLRVAVDAIQRDLIMAGAGTYSGSAQGSLGSFFSPILPHTVGTLVPGDPDNPDPTAITIMYVPPTSAQTTLSSPMPNESAELKVKQQAGCPTDDPLCGFNKKPKMRVLIYDATGAYDVFTITQVQGDALHLQHRDDKFTTQYDTGAYITEMETHTYYLNAEERRLYHYDGYQTNLPVVDNVVGLRFEYFGEAAPAMLRKPVTDDKGPWTTYGPKPPLLATDYSSDDYGPGENCAFQVVAGNHVPRMADWSGGAAGGPLVPISYAELSNGPWCPGMTNDNGDELPNRFDVDMLRVRKVRVTVRVQVGDEAMRGANPPGQTLFVNPGTAADGSRYISDQEIRFEVAPRNLNIGR
jgi:prepilin-type N-terminal cleavage/methylation domain-containing protein